MGDSAKVEGFDFAYQGLIGIWEGFQPILGDEGFGRSGTVGRPESPFVASMHASVEVLPSGTRTPSALSGHRVQHSSHLRDGSGNDAGSIHSSRRASTQLVNFDTAVSALNDARSKITGSDTVTVGMSYPPLDIKTAKHARRKLALALCEWDLTKDEFVSSLQR